MSVCSSDCSCLLLYSPKLCPFSDLFSCLVLQRVSYLDSGSLHCSSHSGCMWTTTKRDLLLHHRLRSIKGPKSLSRPAPSVKMTEMTCAACHRQSSGSFIPSPWISDMILLKDYGLPCRYLLWMGWVMTPKLNLAGVFFLAIFGFKCSDRPVWSLACVCFIDDSCHKETV